TGTISGYQWHVSTNGTTWTNVTGETTATFNLTNLSTGKDGNKYRIIVSGACGNITSGVAKLTVNAPKLTLSPTILPPGFVGVKYSQNFTTNGGVSPYTYSVSSGSLPDGLTLNN